MNVPQYLVEVIDGLHYLEKKGVADDIRSYVKEKINSGNLDISADYFEFFRFIDEIGKKWNIDVLSEDYVINKAIEFYNQCLKGEELKKDNAAQALFYAICYGLGFYMR